QQLGPKGQLMRTFMIMYHSGTAHETTTSIDRASFMLEKGWMIKELVDVKIRDVPVTSIKREIV
ncbi:hypothetical protein WB334_25775, partial [Escherichia coli]|uniref:hypothetical protein n=1 Tax=Escherichia coli TaxID=562 RepID=UPI002157A6E9